MKISNEFHQWIETLVWVIHITTFSQIGTLIWILFQLEIFKWMLLLKECHIMLTNKVFYFEALLWAIYASRFNQNIWQIMFWYELLILLSVIRHLILRDEWLLLKNSCKIRTWLKFILIKLFIILQFYNFTFWF